MVRKICFATMVWEVCISILCGCGPSSNEKPINFVELDCVDYSINNDGTYICRDINYCYKMEVLGFEGGKQVSFVVLTNDKTITFEEVSYSLKKAEISMGVPRFIILGWYLRD